MYHTKQFGPRLSAQERKQPGTEASAKVQRRLDGDLDQAEEVEEEAVQPNLPHSQKDSQGGAEVDEEAEVNNASTPLLGSRSGPHRVAKNRCHPVACPAAALRVAVALETPATSSAEVQLQAGTKARPIRCRGSEAVVGVRLRQTGNRSGTGEGLTAR